MAEFLLKSDIQEITERLGNQAQAVAGKTVLLTGGRGFLGRYFMEVFAHLNEHVLDQPVRLVALDNLITAGKRQGLDVSAGDRVIADIARMFPSSVEWTLNDAWYLELRERIANAILDLKARVTRP